MIDNLTIEQIISLDIDKYLRWLYSRTSLPDMEMSEFLFLRENELNTHLFFYESEVSGGNPFPIDKIQEMEVQKISDRVTELYSSEAIKLFNGWVTKEYHLMAHLFGCIDFIKFIYSEQAADSIKSSAADALIKELNNTKPEQSTFLPFPPAAAPPPATIDKNQFIKDTLQPLSGKWWSNENKIMSATEYERVLTYTIYLIEKKALPKKIMKISRTAATSEFIRYTYYLLYRHTRKAIPRILYCEFIHKTFDQFGSLEIQSITKHFSTFAGDDYSDIVKLIANTSGKQQQK